MRKPKIALIALSLNDGMTWLRNNNLDWQGYRICLTVNDIRGNIFAAVHATPAAEKMRDYKELLLLAQMRVVTNAE